MNELPVIDVNEITDLARIGTESYRHARHPEGLVILFFRNPEHAELRVENYERLSALGFSRHLPDLCTLGSTTENETVVVVSDLAPNKQKDALFDGNGGEMFGDYVQNIPPAHEAAKWRLSFLYWLNTGIVNGTDTIIDEWRIMNPQSKDLIEERVNLINDPELRDILHVLLNNSPDDCLNTIDPLIEMEVKSLSQLVIENNVKSNRDSLFITTHLKDGFDISSISEAQFISGVFPYECRVLIGDLGVGIEFDSSNPGIHELYDAVGSASSISIYG